MWEFLITEPWYFQLAILDVASHCRFRFLKCFILTILNTLDGKLRKTKVSGVLLGSLGAMDRKLDFTLESKKRHSTKCILLRFYFSVKSIFDMIFFHQSSDGSRFEDLWVVMFCPLSTQHTNINLGERDVYVNQNKILNWMPILFPNQ